VLGELQRDQALAQHMLHRLPKAKVDPQRQRRDQLSDPNAARIRPAIFARYHKPLAGSAETSRRLVTP
jgi:hypothetical protein